MKSKPFTIVLFLLIMLLVAACQAQEPDATATAEPATPTEQSVPATEESQEPTAEPTEMVSETDSREQGSSPSFELLDECFVEMPEGLDYECGNVTVPEFHDVDNGLSMTLGVVRLLSPAEVPAEPMFFGAGGPGGSLLDFAALTAESIVEDDTSVYAQLLQDRDLVFFSQRGTAYSEPELTCGDDTFDTFYEVAADGGTAEERHETLIETYKGCYDELRDAGVDLTAYTSVQNAADVNTIRETLGYDQIIYYGESYGTLLGQHIMRDFPETVTAAILDGTIPISAPTWQTDLDDKYQQSLTNLLDLCAADEACSTAYPNLADDIEAVYQQMGTDPVDVTFLDSIAIPIEPSVLAGAIYDALYSPTLAALVPFTVESLLSGTPDPQINRVLSPAIAPSSSVNFFMHYAMVCSEDPPTAVEDAFSLDDLAYSIIPTYIEMDTEEYLQLCAYLGLPILPEETDEVVASDLPVLRLSGALDPITPAFASDEMMASLPNSFSFNFPYGGHVQFLSGNPCAQNMVKAFIDDPTTEPDSSCIVDTLPLQFVLPAGSDAANDLGMLTSEFWLWSSFTSPEESFDVEMPEDYLIFFNEAGAINIGADCNSASGSYTFNGSNLTIELGPTTLAACEEGSRSEQFVNLLGSAAIAFFEDGNLSIDLMADGGTMVFTPEE